MTCKEEAEFISALYDGEAIPRAAAEHIGACELCQAQRKHYLELGVELRRIASVELAEEAPSLVLEERQPWSSSWWQKGRGSMRIPRLAFVALVVAVVLLGSSLAVVGVRAHARTQGTVVLLKSTPSGSQPYLCALSTVNKKQDSCAYVGKVDGGWLVYGVKVLSSAGDRIDLGLRSRLVPQDAHPDLSLSMINSLPEADYSFELGKSLEVNVPGAGIISFSGEWTDHIPALSAGTSEIDPAPGELRIASPLLLLDKKVVGDQKGGLASVNEAGSAVTLYYPGQGLFELSLTELPGAVRGKVELNRATFESGSKSYTLVTGSPITRDPQIWIAHDPDYRPAQGAENGFIASGDARFWASKEKTEISNGGK